MLPKQHRLRRTSDFVRVRRRGRSSSTPLLVVYLLPNDRPETRVGFSVSKKVGKAVVRNRVKRMLREAFRARLKDIADGMDVVAIARPPASQATHREIEAAVDGLILSSGALRSPVSKAGNA